MPRNWDPSQNLSNGRVEWPQGPLTDDNNTPVPTATWTPKYLDAWVVQDSTGASQATRQYGNWVLGRWKADQNPWKNGNFQRGLALGIALVAYKENTADEAEWWVRAINLR
jgi:hypothetical protein